MNKNLALACGFALCATVGTNAANITWVSFHPGDDTPSAAAATAGFTRAPDVGYTDLLRGAGHNVTRYTSRDIPEASVLNASDLVIISRSVPSGHYELDAETAAWNGITAPTMILGGYVLRNSRLGYVSGTTIPDTTTSIKLQIDQPSHPIFDGIALDGSNVTVDDYAGIAMFNGNTQRGISINTNPLAGGGLSLARVATGFAPAGGLVIAEWQAGATMATTPADTLAGHRLVFLTGSRESGTPALTSEGAGIYDLTPTGADMFLNAVDYMAVPEPGTYALFGLGAAALLLLRRRK